MSINFVKQADLLEQFVILEEHSWDIHQLGKSGIGIAFVPSSQIISGDGGSRGLQLGGGNAAGEANQKRHRELFRTCEKILESTGSDDIG